MQYEWMFRHVVDSKCISENKKRSGNGHCEGDNGSYRMQTLETSEGHGEDREGWQLLMKGIEQMEEGLDMMKSGLELQKKAANFFIKKVEEEKKD